MTSQRAFLAAAGLDTLRSYEDAATAVGRLDAAGSLAPPGLRRLLTLRCAVRSSGTGVNGMIALLRPDGEGEPADRSFLRALEAGAGRARGGVVPSVAMIAELLGMAPSDFGAPGAAEGPLGEPGARTPPLLRAVHASGAILQSAPRDDGNAATSGARRAAALAVALLLCVGGSTTDAWLTIPLAGDPLLTAGPADTDAGWDEWMRAAFAALAREARLAERGLAVARARAEADEERVREALGRAAYSAVDVLRLLRSDLALTVPDAARTLQQTPPTAGAALARLEELGIAREVTGRARSRVFVYPALVDALAPTPG